MIEGWEEKTLGDVIEINVDSVGKDYPHDVILYLDTGSVTRGHFDEPVRVALDEAPSRAKRLVQHESIVYSCVRPIQRHYGFIKHPPSNLVVSTGFVVINVDLKLASPQFIYALLSSDQMVETFDIVADASTSAYPAMKPDDIEAQPIDLPPLQEQKAIAEILSSLDDKIDLLHRQNATLEALAETLFRQTFIEEAQDDWEECSLIDAIQLLGGGTPKTKVEAYWNGNIPWLSCGDIAAKHRSFVGNSEKFISIEGLENSSAKLLPANATVVTARGTVGKFALLARPMAFSQSNYGVMPAAQFKNCFYFTYLLVNHSIAELQSTAYGSVFDTITVRSFEAISLRLPKPVQVAQFDGEVAPYIEKMHTNSKQIVSLEELRDRLLPKLMSGQVRLEGFGNV